MVFIDCLDTQFCDWVCSVKCPQNTNQVCGNFCVFVYGNADISKVMFCHICQNGKQYR